MLRNRTLKIAKTVLSMISCIIKLPENGRFLNDILEFYPVNIHTKILIYTCSNVCRNFNFVFRTHMIDNIKIISFAKKNQKTKTHCHAHLNEYTRACSILEILIVEIKFFKNLMFSNKGGSVKKYPRDCFIATRLRHRPFVRHILEVTR